MDSIRFWARITPWHVEYVLAAIGSECLTSFSIDVEFKSGDLDHTRWVSLDSDNDMPLDEGLNNENLSGLGFNISQENKGRLIPVPELGRDMVLLRTRLSRRDVPPLGELRTQSPIAFLLVGDRNIEHILNDFVKEEEHEILGSILMGSIEDFSRRNKFWRERLYRVRIHSVEFLSLDQGSSTFGQWRSLQTLSENFHISNNSDLPVLLADVEILSTKPVSKKDRI